MTTTTTKNTSSTSTVEDTMTTTNTSSTSTVDSTSTDQQISVMGGVGGELRGMLTVLKALMTEIMGDNAEIQEDQIGKTWTGAKQSAQAQKDATNDDAYNTFIDAGTSFFSTVTDLGVLGASTKFGEGGRLAGKSTEIDNKLKPLNTMQKQMAHTPKAAIVAGGNGTVRLANGGGNREQDDTDRIRRMQTGNFDTPGDPIPDGDNFSTKMTAPEHEDIRQALNKKVDALNAEKDTYSRLSTQNQQQWTTTGDLAKNLGKTGASIGQGFDTMDKANKTNDATMYGTLKDTSQQSASSAAGAETQAANEYAGMLRDIRAASNPKA